MLSNEQLENLQQLSAVKKEKKENLKPYIFGVMFLICYILAQFIRVNL